jgi:hypothetical protein
MHPDDQEMYFGKIYDIFPKYKQNIKESLVAKRLIVEGIQRIDQLIKEKIMKKDENKA